MMQRSRWSSLVTSLKTAVLLAALGGLPCTAVAVEAAPPGGASSPPVLRTLDDRLVDIARRAPTFGGMVLDVDTGTLVVHVVGADGGARVEQAILAEFSGEDVATRKVKVVPARYSLLELHGWYRRMSDVLAVDGVVLIDLNEGSNRLQVGISPAGHEDAVRRRLAALGIPDEAVLVTPTQPVVPMLRQRHRPPLGGIQTDSMGTTCTLGFTAQHADTAARGFVTASHCTAEPGTNLDTPFWQPVEDEDNLLGHEELDPPFFTRAESELCPVDRRCRFSDAAWVQAVEAGPLWPPSVARVPIDLDPATEDWDGESVFRITSKGDAVLQGTLIEKVGRTTGRTQGEITNTCIAVNVSGTDITRLCETFVLAMETESFPMMDEGDSGAAALEVTGDPEPFDARLVGIFWGGTGPQGIYSPISDVEAELGALHAFPTPELTVTPAGLDFGDVPVGATSPPQTAELRNTGTETLTDLAFNEPGSAFEVDTSGCPLALDPGMGCEVQVVFTPTELGPVEDVLEVGSAEEASSTLTLTGTGAGEPSFTAVALEVDPATAAGSDGNGVLEPGEQVEVAPEWLNEGTVAGALTATASAFTGPSGADYTLAGADAAYGTVDPEQAASCRDTGTCYAMAVSDPAVRPATHWEATFEETLSDDTTKTWTLHIGDSFPDVPRSSIFYAAIETLLGSGVTAGCGAGDEYCPGDANSRSQMPVFMLRALMGPDYTPSACAEGKETFSDVPFDSVFCPWIQDLADRGVVSGCGGDDYCPSDPVSRAQMAIFILRTLEGADYEPIECTNRFTDVPCSSLFADWIEDLAARGITGGCTATEYCPTDAVTRGQMAVFISRAFGFTLYGP